MPSRLGDQWPAVAALWEYSTRQPAGRLGRLLAPPAMPSRFRNQWPVVAALWEYSTWRPPGRLGGGLTLEHFIHRSRALALYRAIVRDTRAIQDSATRAETRRFVREEFDRNRHVADLDHARYLLATGRTEWQQMERYVRGQGG